MVELVVEQIIFCFQIVLVIFQTDTKLIKEEGSIGLE